MKLHHISTIEKRTLLFTLFYPSKMLSTLSVDLLELIIMEVAHSLEKEGVRGPTIVVRDVLAIASTCTVIRRASVVALEWIAGMI